MKLLKMEYVSPIASLAVFIGTWVLAGLTVAFIMLGLATAIFIIIGIVSRAAKLPSRDSLGSFHDSKNGRYIRPRQAGMAYTSLGASVVIALLTKVESIALAVPFFTSLPSEIQAFFIVAGQGAGYWLNG